MRTLSGRVSIDGFVPQAPRIKIISLCFQELLREPDPSRIRETIECSHWPRDLPSLEIELLRVWSRSGAMDLVQQCVQLLLSILGKPAFVDITTARDRTLAHPQQLDS